MQGTIDTIELPVPTPEEPENLEFFAEFDVPLECALAEAGALDHVPTYQPDEGGPLHETIERHHLSDHRWHISH